MSKANKLNLICLIGQLGNGGTEKQLSLFLKYLDREKYEPVIVSNSSDEGRWAKYIRDDLSIPVISLGKIPKLAKLAKFRLITGKYRPHIIFSWSFFTNAYSLVSGKKNFISSLRGDLYAARQQLGELHWKQCLKANHFVVNSSFLAEELKKESVDEQSISVINNIFEPNKVKESRKQIRKRFNIPEDAVVISGVGRNTPEKNFPFFLDVFKETSNSVKNLHAFLIGSKGEKMENEILQRGLNDKVTVTEVIEDAEKLLPAGDIFFLSSKTEGMSNVLLEAVNAGSTVFTTNVGGTEDIFGKLEQGMQSKIITGNGNIESASAKLRELALNPGLRKNICAETKKVLVNFSPDRIMKQYRNLLKTFKH